MRRHSKYNARRTVVDGVAFASRLEADTYAELRLLERGRQISDLEMQVRVEPAACPHCGVRPAPSVKVDFRFIEKGKHVYAEAKGVITERYRDFERWWRVAGPGELRVYKPGNRGVRLTEVIFPRGNS